jgi:1-acyl-sn-glycerol-3-phosphate acyltransferase
LTIQVARTHFTEVHPHGKGLIEFDGQSLLAPADTNLWPDPVYLEWHRERRFLDGDKSSG